MELARVIRLKSATWGFVFLALAGCDAPEEPVAAMFALSEQATILILGDQFAAGEGVNAEESFPSRLQSLSGHNVLNAALAGESSRESLERVQALLANIHPELVIIMHGHNDLARRYGDDATRDNLIAMIDLIYRNGIQVVFMGMPGRIRDGDPVTVHPIYDQVAGAIDYNVELPYLRDSLVEVLTDPDLRQVEALPNAAGHERIARSLFQYLQRAGAIEPLAP